MSVVKVLPPLLKHKLEIRNLMMSQVHFNSQKTWALQNSKLACAVGYMQAIFANVQKSDSQPVYFCLFPLTLCKTWQSSGQKVYVQNTFFVDLLQKLWMHEGELKEVRANN